LNTEDKFFDTRIDADLLDPLLAQARLVVFHHIHKTAGSTFSLAIERSPCDRPVFFLRDEDEKMAFLRDETWKKHDRCFISCHRFYGILDELGEQVTYVATLRNPMNRLIADFYWRQGWGQGRSGSPRETLDDFIEFVHQVDNANHQVYDLALYESEKLEKITPFSEKNTHAMSVDDALDKARERLRTSFAFVGIADLLDESLFLFFNRMGWERIAMWTREATTSSYRPQVEDLPWYVQKRLRKILEADQELYDEQRILLEKQIKDYPLGEAFKNYKAMGRIEDSCYNKDISYPKVVRLEGEQKRQGHELKRQKELTTKLMERNKKLMDLYIKAVG